MNSTPEVVEYLKQAREKIEVARLLRDAQKYNDAISRVYYAFFDAATASLLTKGVEARTHQGVVILFQQHFIHPGLVSPEIGRWLARAKEAREEADYEIFKQFDQATVDAGIRAAEAFVSAVESLLV